MLTKKAKYNINSILTLCIGLITLLSLFFVLVRQSYNSSSAYNGFTLLSFPSYVYTSFLTSIGMSFIKLFLCLQIIIAIGTIIVPLVSNMFLKQDLAEKIYLSANIACLSSNAIYLIIGIALSVKLTKELNEGLNNNKYVCPTEAYGGLIITILLATAFFVVMFAIKTKDENISIQVTDNDKTATKQSANEIELENTKNIVETLKQYKNLLDEGIISEEDFNNMKNKLLKITKENVNKQE